MTKNITIASDQEKLLYKKKSRSWRDSLFLNEAPEVVEAGLLPFLGILQLVLQAVVDLLPALFVDGGSCLLPDVGEVLDLLHASGIAELKFFPKGIAALQAVGPGRVVEPEQVAFRAGVDIVVYRAVWLAVL